MKPEAPSPAPRASWDFGKMAVAAPPIKGPSQGALQTAQDGVSDQGNALPHGQTIQQSFGLHDVGGVQAHAGRQTQTALSALGAQAYAIGDDVALDHPSQFDAAHEAAHVVQQRSAGLADGPAVSQPHDRFEDHADSVARQVVAGRSAQQLLDNPPQGAIPAVQRKDGDPVPQTEEDKRKADTSTDLDAITAAGKREQDPKDKAPLTTINAASIVFRILRTFHPELEQRWWISGVGASTSVKGVKLELSGTKDVSITVGRDFVLQTDEAHLQDRVDDIGRAFSALEADPTKKAATTEVQNSKAVDFSKALEEGGAFFASKAGFGLTAGNKPGPDPEDGYDARNWKEEGRGIVATVEPWLAMSLMVQHAGDEVPTKDGRKTHWHFDCFEGSEAVRKYAEWRTMSRTEFNKKNTPLHIGFSIYLRDGDSDLAAPIKADKPGDKPYTESGEPVASMAGGVMTFTTPRVPAGPSMDKVLDDALAGSWVCFTNLDVTAKLAQHAKNVAAGKPISPEQQDFIDRITPWNNENTVKISQDKYSAFPLGIKNADEITKEMAKIVFGDKPVPADYIKKNIFVSVVANKKD